MAGRLRSAEAERTGTAELRRVLTILCVTQITAWGILFYAFPVLAPTISASTGWPITTVIAGLSLSQIVAALVGIPVGRVLDRHGPRWVMTGGSVLAVLAVVSMATARWLPWFVLSWVLIGVAMAMVLYQPAFAALTRWYGEGRVPALTAVTLVGGLASTVFAPLTAALVEHLDWRQTYLVLALILGVITIPAHALGLRLPWPEHVPVEHHVEGNPGAIARSRTFAILVVSLSLGAFAVYAVVVATVPLLNERGYSTSMAALALGLGGIGQVLGRLGYSRLVTRLDVRARTVAILLTASTTTVLLGLIPGPATLLIVASMFAGTARGVFTLLHATAISDRWGSAHYGRLSGLLHAPLMVTGALAPWVATALAGVLGGYPAVFVFLALVGGLAAVLSLRSVP